MPETYFPDNNKVDADFTDGVLTLTPKPTAFGKQFQLVIRILDGSQVKIRNIIRNISDTPSVFAPWSITGMTPGGIEFIPLCKEQTGFLPNRTMALWSYTDLCDPRFSVHDSYAVLRQDTQNEKPFKMGCNVTDGFMVYCVGNQVFKKTFAPYDGSIRYPDFACNFETYTNHLFLECELLGAEKAYEPGESAVIEETWKINETDLKPEDLIVSLADAR